jgi:LysM repeat protein
MLRRLFLLLLFIPVFATHTLAQSDEYFLHTVEQGQTVYGISHLYNVSPEAVYELNPNAMNGIRIGEELKIPQPAGAQPKKPAVVKSEKLSTINMAVLLPFPTGNRIVEYYEGVLLALKTAKEEGISVDLQVYNTGVGVDSVYPILRNPKLKKANIIIGGLSDGQIKLISDFSRENNITYVIPLASNSNIPTKQANVFQVNTPQSHSTAKASTAFVKKYKNDHIIFYTPNGAGNKLDFVKLLKKDLTLSNVTFLTIKTLDELSPLLSTDKNNVLIPSDDSETVLLQSLLELKSAWEKKPNLDVSLFGYPSWQVYSNKYLDNFSRLNATFYSLFYADPTSSEVKSFRNNYTRWYSKNLINTFPKYGMLGYDTSWYFIQLLHKYGTAYENHVNQITTNGVQTKFYFEKLTPDGGFVNTHLYFVQFHPGAFITTQSIK